MDKRTFFAVALVALLGSTSAWSADVAPPVLKAPPALQAPGWTGFYAGVQAGAGFGKARQSDFLGFDTGDYNLSGGLAGVTWGYNWQIGNTVVGFESDAAWAKISGSTAGRGASGSCFGVTPKCSAELQAFGTNRLRLGYAFDRWLPFVTGGMAWGYVHGAEGDVPAGGFVGSGAEFHYGWTIGAGVEAVIDPHWSAKAEYLYADLRSGKTFSEGIAGVGSITESVGMHVHIVRVGLNYKFNPGSGLLLDWLPHNPGPGTGPWNWGGFYAGVNYGGGAGRASQSDTFFDRGQYDVSGGLIGGTIGYNFQHGRLVYGAEADLDYTSIKGATSGNAAILGACGLGSLINCETKLNWLGTARARVGISVDRLLPYITAGAAFGKLTSSEGAAPLVLYGSGSSTRLGWAAGAGIEARIDDRWSAKLEYLYVDLGSREGFTDQLATLPTTFSETVSFRTHIMRGGLNYKFN
ncbi:MAG TPA: outer membrane protein [Pseudolabrys sp.]|jgi:outer membrane immunogenic protein